MFVLMIQSDYMPAIVYFTAIFFVDSPALTI